MSGGRYRLAVVVVAVLAAVGVLAASGLGESVVFYRTPTELTEDEELRGDRVRLGGLVKPGSVGRSATADGTVVRFTLTDGTTETAVVFTGRLAGVFREGQGALVEGVLGADGVFRGDHLMVKHSNSYRGPDGQTYTPPEEGGG